MQQGIYSDLKLSFHHEKIMAIAEGRLTAPIYVRIKPINACNQRCFYCCYQDETYGLTDNFRPSDKIPFDKLKEIINDLSDMGTRAITFSGGGEPLLYPNIVEVAELALSRGLKISLITNGELLSGSIAKVFGNASWVRLSLDGHNDDLFARIRKTKPDSFTRTIANLKEFAGIKAPGCELGINLVVNHLNYEHVYEMVEVMKSAKADHVKIMGRLTRDFNIYHQPFFNTVRLQIEKAVKDLSADSFTIIDKYHEISELSVKPFPVCYYIQCAAIIGADQVVYSCHDKAYSKMGAMGSIKDRPFKDFWFSPELKEKLLAINPEQACHHHCVALNKNHFLSQLTHLNFHHIDFV